MSGEAQKKYEELKSKIEKTVNPYIVIQIPIPEDVDKEAFLELENVRREAINWIDRKKSKRG